MSSQKIKKSDLSNRPELSTKACSMNPWIEEQLFVLFTSSSQQCFLLNTSTMFPDF